MCKSSTGDESGKQPSNHDKANWDCLETYFRAYDETNVLHFSLVKTKQNKNIRRPGDITLV